MLKIHSIIQIQLLRGYRLKKVVILIVTNIRVMGYPRTILLYHYRTLDVTEAYALNLQ